MSEYSDDLADWEAEQVWQDERREAQHDAAVEDFDNEFAEGECSYDNPDCEWVTEHDYDGQPYYWCEAHEV